MTEKLPALGTNGDLMLVDRSFYVIGDREYVLAASPHKNFLMNQIVLRVVSRFDGQPLLDKKVTLQDGTSTASPFVILN